MWLCKLYKHAHKIINFHLIKCVRAIRDLYHRKNRYVLVYIKICIFAYTDLVVEGIQISWLLIDQCLSVNFFSASLYMKVNSQEWNYDHLFWFQHSNLNIYIYIGSKVSSEQISINFWCNCIFLRRFWGFFSKSRKYAFEI